MPFCGAGKAITPLESHARSLSGRPSAPGDGTPALLFPMYTIPLGDLLDMGEIEPHEVLKDRGALVEFQESQGRAAFVSHQWVGRDHPDPEFRQLRVLQDALRHIMTDMKFIPLDMGTETFLPDAKALDTKAFRERPLFIWYDYFSCPQLQSLQRRQHCTDSSDFGKAVQSIPAYISRCSFFFVLCPVIDSASQHKVFSPDSWADRGWCRFETACRELCADGSWILVKSRTEMELIATATASICKSPGEGDFTVCTDKDKLAPVLLQALRRKLFMYLANQDLVNYRVLLNLQSVHLKGFDVEPLQDLIPGYDPEPGFSCPAVSQFLYQNGFPHVNAMDSSGWAPLHYAALSGDAALIKSLIEHRANLDRVTKKSQPLAGLPPWASALSISAMFVHNDAVRLLVAAKAKATGGLQTPMHWAAGSNNTEAIRILCDAGHDPNGKDIFGLAPFEIACSVGSVEAAQEIARQAGSRLNVSRGLYIAMTNRGGKAELVNLLIGLRADVNHQWQHRVMSLIGVYMELRTLQHKVGKATVCSRIAYHSCGLTPLMGAVMTGQYAGAAALISAGARLDLRNSRNYTAADFAREKTIPQFLLEALEGQKDEAQRVASDAVLVSCAF